MKKADLIFQIEQMTEFERHQFLAGCNRHVQLRAKKIIKAKAEGQRKNELGIEERKEEQCQQYMI